MREQLLATQRVTSEDGTPITLSYYLLIEELLDHTGAPVCEIYGARIIKERTAGVTQHAVPRITMLGSEILRIVEALSQGTVMPETMEDCVLELLA